MSTEKTLGERRVRTTFNPSNNDLVQQIKEAGANFINLVNSFQKILPDTQTANEAGRLKALALTTIEEGTMWAVKMATI